MMKQPPQEYRRKLPHIQPEQAVYFVTFNLKDSLPKHIINQLSESHSAVVADILYSTKNKEKAYVNYDEQINTILDDAKYGNTWLEEPEIAQIVAQSFHFLDGHDFKLICYCIMSNHVHFIAYKLNKPLFKVMNSLKAYTARACNKKLNRSGRFWQREYFDRIVRNRNNLAKKIEYVLNNPVNAGLVGNWKEWPFTYCNPNFIEEVDRHDSGGNYQKKNN